MEEKIDVKKLLSQIDYCNFILYRRNGELEEISNWTYIGDYIGLKVRLTLKSGEQVVGYLENNYRDEDFAHISVGYDEKTREFDIICIPVSSVEIIEAILCSGLRWNEYTKPNFDFDIDMPIRKIREYLFNQKFEAIGEDIDCNAEGAYIELSCIAKDMNISEQECLLRFMLKYKVPPTGRYAFEEIFEFIEVYDSNNNLDE